MTSGHSVASPKEASSAKRSARLAHYPNDVYQFTLPVTGVEFRSEFPGYRSEIVRRAVPNPTEPTSLADPDLGSVTYDDFFAYVDFSIRYPSRSPVFFMFKLEI